MAFKKKSMTAAEKEAHKAKKAADLETAMDRLKQGVAALLTSDGYRDYLLNMSKFHNYSYRNMILILWQLPTATRCAGFHTWKKMGRTVKKGEKGLQILAPSPFTITKTDKDTGEEKRVKIMRFTTVATFDVSQTEGKPLPSSGVEMVAGSGEMAAWLYENLTTIAHKFGYIVRRENTLPAHGYCNNTSKIIAVGDHLDGNHAAKTLCHEVAHMLADHCYHRDGRDNAETVAESAAFVVLSRYGIDTSGYTFGYVAHWAQNEKVLHQNLTDVQKLANQIIESLEGAEESADTDDGGEVEELAA